MFQTSYTSLVRLPFSNSFSRTQQIRRLIGAGALLLTIALLIVGGVWWDELKAHPKLFAYLWTITLLGAWLGIILAVWDILDVARQSATQRRKMMEEHFSDEKYLGELREKASENDLERKRREIR